jgi:aminoglycoside phosphotransferase (APT) family kinase protein
VEELRANLEQFLARATGADWVSVSAIEPLAGGAIQDNWRIAIEIDGGTLDGHLEAVIRRDPEALPAVSHHRHEEFALLQAAFAAGVTVPEPLWLCQDPAVLGRPFFVMRRVEGTAQPHRILRDERLGGDRATLARRLGAELARIHSIRPPRPDLAFLPLPDGPPALAAVREYRGFLDRHRDPRPVLELGLAWLHRHAPPTDALVLAHRDFRTGNFMVDATGITGILDWEFAAWGDPLEDLGWFCAGCWRFGAADREAGGVGDRESLYAGYEAAGGRRIDRRRVFYWEVMAHLRWAVIALQQVDRHLSGEQSSLELALTGHIVPELERAILAMTGETGDG